jgi:hypothetical protein
MYRDHNIGTLPLIADLATKKKKIETAKILFLKVLLKKININILTLLATILRWGQEKERERGVILGKSLSYNRN